MVSWTLLCFYIGALLQLACAERCLKGSYHRKSAGPADKHFAICKPWEKHGCCTSNFTVSLQRHETQELYNHSWHRCGQLSRPCRDFWVMQECFYQCSPYTSPWENPQIAGALQGLPVCSTLCDRWYHACKDDKICVENVLVDYDFTSAGANVCPKSSSCKTYAEMYGSGEKLCNKMWGDSYVFTRENKDASNCMQMWFDGDDPNPNARVSKGASTTSAVDKRAQQQSCLPGPVHRSVSGPADKSFIECKPWQKNSCCSSKTASSIHHFETQQLYNFTWHGCGKLSRKCADYWIEEECFYQCSPYLKKWQHPLHKDALKRVPICSKTCDGWYEACKEDMTCVENVLVDYNFTAWGQNSCPSNKPCVTYETMYGSGEALCNKMWGEAFHYVKENSDQTNCMTMWFKDGDTNPNAKFIAAIGSAEAFAPISKLSIGLGLITFIGLVL